VRIREFRDIDDRIVMICFDTCANALHMGCKQSQTATCSENEHLTFLTHLGLFYDKLRAEIRIFHWKTFPPPSIMGDFQYTQSRLKTPELTRLCLAIPQPSPHSRNLWQYHDLFFPCLAVIFLNASIPPAPIGLAEGSKPLVGSKVLFGATV
jgi:hypothetical protein